MNIINIIIISVALFSLLVIIVVVARSLKNTDDEKIIKDIEKEVNSAKPSFYKRIKTGFISLAEVVLRKIKLGLQKTHSWIIREKKKNSNDILKARAELTLTEEKGNSTVAKNILTDKIVKDISQENTVDSLSDSKSKKPTKKSFISRLFKKNKAAKNLDIKKKKNISQPDDGKKWVLGSLPSQDEAEAKMTAEEQETPQSPEKTVADDEDAILGVDYQIIEKKILQRINNSPKNLNNYYELGELYIKMEKLDDALEVFSYLHSVSPADETVATKIKKIKYLQSLRQEKIKMPR